MSNELSLNMQEATAIGLALAHYTAQYEAGTLGNPPISPDKLEKIIATMNRLKVTLISRVIAHLPEEIREELMTKIENGDFEREPKES